MSTNINIRDQTINLPREFRVCYVVHLSQWGRDDPWTCLYLFQVQSVARDDLFLSYQNHLDVTGTNQMSMGGGIQNPAIVLVLWMLRL